MIIIYKDEEMKDIRNILPLYPFFMRISFIDNLKKIIFKYPLREQALSFFDNENYLMWMSTLKDIFNKRIKSRMDILEYFQVNENREKEKIIQEISTEILCVHEEMNELKKKMEKINNKFMEKLKNNIK